MCVVITIAFIISIILYVAYYNENTEGMREVIDLYDVNREHTGLTAVRGEKLPEGTYRMVVHVCIFNSKGEMLIQKRADDIVRWPGMWDVSVGGAARHFS